MVPRGSGIHKVCNDNKVIFTRGQRELNYIERKVSPRTIKWTESSRAFYRKTHKDEVEKTEFVPITKIVRGFSLVPKSLVSSHQAAKPAETGERFGATKSKRYLKNSNAQAFRK